MKVAAAVVKRVLENSFGRLVKKVQLRGARRIDERMRTCAVRWSEVIERNEANEPFSTAWLEQKKKSPLAAQVVDWTFAERARR